MRERAYNEINEKRKATNETRIRVCMAMPMLTHAHRRTNKGPRITQTKNEPK